MFMRSKEPEAKQSYSAVDIVSFFPLVQNFSNKLERDKLRLILLCITLVLTKKIWCFRPQTKHLFNFYFVTRVQIQTIIACYITNLECNKKC